MERRTDGESDEDRQSEDSRRPGIPHLLVTVHWIQYLFIHYLFIRLMYAIQYSVYSTGIDLNKLIEGGVPRVPSPTRARRVLQEEQDRRHWLRFSRISREKSAVPWQVRVCCDAPEGDSEHILRTPNFADSPNMFEEPAVVAVAQKYGKKPQQVIISKSQILELNGYMW